MWEFWTICKKLVLLAIARQKDLGYNEYSVNLNIKQTVDNVGNSANNMGNKDNSLKNPRFPSLIAATPHKKIKVITVIKIGRKVNAIKVIVNRFFKFIFHASFFNYVQYTTVFSSKNKAFSIFL